MQTALTDSESQLLSDLEGTIERGQRTFIEVGNALAIIRDQKLYRNDYETFDAYLTARWQFTRSYAGRIIEAARVAEMLPIGNKPETESQARELSKVPAEKRVEVMQAAQDLAKSENRPVRAKDIQAVSQPTLPSDDAATTPSVTQPNTARVAPSFTLRHFREDVSGLVDLAIEVLSDADLAMVQTDLDVLMRKVRDARKAREQKQKAA
jgi:hypothetical protein